MILTEKCKDGSGGGVQARFHSRGNAY